MIKGLNWKKYQQQAVGVFSNSNVLNNRGRILDIHKISIIIPIYNEVNILKEVLERIQKASFAGLEKEIIIVDDGSFDGTTDLLKNIQDSSEFKIYFHDKNQGKGAAIRTALSYASGEIIVIQDADLEYNPDDYDKILNLIINNKASVVYGSRLLGEGHERVFKFWSRLFNKFITQLANCLYGKNLTDIETCYKAFRADIIKNIKIESNGFSFDPEITAKILKKSHKISEVPISYFARGYNEGKKIMWTDAFSAIYTLIKYKFSS